MWAEDKHRRAASAVQCTPAWYLGCVPRVCVPQVCVPAVWGGVWFLRGRWRPAPLPGAAAAPGQQHTAAHRRPARCPSRHSQVIHHRHAMSRHTPPHIVRHSIVSHTLSRHTSNQSQSRHSHTMPRHTSNQSVTSQSRHVSLSGPPASR